VYSRVHVGNARPFVVFSQLKRFLEHEGYRVKLVANVTDINDKIYDAARAAGRPSGELAAEMASYYREETDRLGLGRPDAEPYASEYIGPIVELIQALIDGGHAYVAGGDVYFRVRTVDGYGELSHRDIEQMDQGEGVEGADLKEDPLDFALWKAHKEGEDTVWHAPWGDGRPGWHIECSAMARETLGDQIDIHGGGRDLIFPHHENELAQSEAYTDVHPFVRYWAHAGLVTTGTEKMAHSLENFTTIRDVLDVYEPMAVRLFLLQTHYRSAILYAREGLDNAERALARLRGALEGFEPSAADPTPPAWADEARAAFEQAMDDDFNTPGALAALFDLVREINRRRGAGEPLGSLAAGQQVLQTLAGVLGLRLDAPSRAADGEDAGPFIDLLLATRQRLREAKQWPLADEIRDRLRDLGVVVEDRPDGAVWRRERPASER
jgi:cysteinyl-tRNA synthetase